MRLLTAFRRMNLYMKLLLGIVLVTVVTLAVASAILFFYFTRIALGQVYRTDLDSLEQTSREVRRLTESAQTLTFQMYRNTTITQLLYYGTPNVYETVAALTEMNNYLLTMPYIDSIYAYNPRTANVYIAADYGQNGPYAKSELADNDILTLLDNYTDYKPLVPIPRYVWTDESRTERKAVYTYLFYDAIGSPDNSLNSAIVVNIDADWIHKDIGGSGSDKIGRTFIIDNSGKLQFGGEERLEAEARDLVERIDRRQGAGYLVGRYAGERSLISYTQADDMDWRYVRVSSYAAVTGKVEDMRRTTILITLAIVAFGLLLSWLQTRRLYAPIDHMASRVSMLEVDRRNNLFTVRQTYLRSLVFGREPVNPKALRERFAALGIGFDIQGEYRIALLGIDGFPAFAEARGADVHVYKYAIMNIASELANQAYQAETVDLEEGLVLLLLGSSSLSSTPAASPEQSDERYIRSMLMQIQNATREHLGLGLSIAYTAPDRQFLHLGALYRQSAEALKYRFHAGRGAILYAPDTIVPPSNEYRYPADRERRLNEAIMAGKTDEARAICDELLDETRRYPIQAAEDLLARLKTALAQSLTMLERNHGIEFAAHPDRHWPPASRIETRAEAERLIEELLAEARDKVEGKRKHRLEDLIGQINELIERQYGDPALSLNLVAELLSMSPSYVGRLYKQHTMNTIVDAIQKVRLERAMELLARTHLPIAEIAEQCGFTSTSYFNRLFKKHYGLTPTDCRKGGERSIGEDLLT
ncbi:AraC family transcriptional regulator [Cohnella fermenti]|uniref:AraC family transcriptional regulator n=1 Tax=Cohnella fermenti TaxID=2565925 RepID=UPI001454C1B9|nr:AraC family transcriptional regulator [Cohnella fermenti]